MNDVILDRLKTFYRAKPGSNDTQALKEMVQEIALLGLWRGKFFEHAAFYGGTALRILYNLDRFSEDLDFTLLSPNTNFKLEPYFRFVLEELKAFGFEAEVTSANKKRPTDTESAFIKLGTRIHLLKINSRLKSDKAAILEIKFEVDVNAALGFNTAAEQFFWPQAFSVLTCDLPSLFAGKLHATFCRKWISNVKGRDWYDLLWYTAKGIAPNYAYLENKLRQSGHWPENKSFSPSKFKAWAKEKVETLDIKLAKQDVERFIADPRRLDGWSKEAFIAAIDRLPGN